MAHIQNLLPGADALDASNYKMTITADSTERSQRDFVEDSIRGRKTKVRRHYGMVRLASVFSIGRGFGMV
jgi:hypothetical protein